MTSFYATTVPDLIDDIETFLLTELQLPTTFKSADPDLGEAYGTLSPQSLSGERSCEIPAVFLASAAFPSYRQARRWAIATALNLDDILPKVNLSVDGRGILGEVRRTSSITAGKPRSPLRANAAQKSTVWVIDVLCPCVLKLAIFRDEIYGHLG